MMLRRSLLAVLLCLAVAPAAARILLTGAGAYSPAAYTDFCSQSFIAGSCVYVYDVQQRRVSSNTVPFQLTRLSDSATHNAAYTGSTFAVNVSDLTTFCLGNGGTTTTLTYSTQYNDCVFTTVYDQVGSGCDLAAGAPSLTGTAHAPPFQVRLSDGKPAIIQTGQTPYNGPSAKYLFHNGCTVLDGSVARTMIGRGNNAYFSGCCGQYGKVETNPPLGLTPAGAMWSAFYFTNGTQFIYTADIEGGASCPSPSLISNSPVVDQIGITTYSAAAGGANVYLNNVQEGSNCTPHSSIATQDGMVIGCSGDYTACGPLYFQNMIFLNIDASLTAGLPAQIYNALL